MITLEEARVLESLARHGSIAGVAHETRRSNSSIVYSLDSIEEKLGLPVFDRSGYRTRLSGQGLRLLEAGRKMLESEAELATLCRNLKGGWETDLKVIVEGVVPLAPILSAVALARKDAPTRFHVRAGFLSEVEQTFGELGADFMVSVLPPMHEKLESVELAEVPALLVAHREHPLLCARKEWRLKDLRSHALLTVRGSDPRLNMSTGILEPDSTIELNDFHSKKLAILQGIGFGWMPRYLIESELKRGIVQPVHWTGASTHRFKPFLYYRGEKRLGKAGRAFMRALA